MSNQIAQTDADAAELAHDGYELAVMVVIGAAHLAGVYRRRGRTGLAMPEMSSIDADLDRRAGRD